MALQARKVFETFRDFVFRFQDNKVSLKLALGHNHENKMFQRGQCPFKHLTSVHFMYCFLFHQDPNKDGESKIKADFAELNEQMQQAFRSLED